LRRIRTYGEFHTDLPIVAAEDRTNFMTILGAMVESHASVDERMMLESCFGPVNESWFSDLADKGKRGVLKVKSKAGELLVDLAKKAKDLLDFAKQLAGQIGEYVKAQFNGFAGKIKNFVLKDNEFAKEIVEFLKNKKPVKLTTYLKDTGDLLKYILTGQMITDLVTRLSETFSNVLNTGTNEGVGHLEYEFLCEAEEQEEKKSFLQRMGEKVMSFPPFNWIPKIEEMMKKGISGLSKIIDRFFTWLTTGTDGPFNKFTKSFIFLFQILEIYVLYKLSGGIKKFKEVLGEATGLEELATQLKDKTLDAVWDLTGINGEQVISSVKAAIQKIPYVGTVLSVLESLVIAVATYQAIEPSVKTLIA
jgi:hypothetical protein